MEHVKAVTAMPLLVPPAEYVIADETARFGPVAARIAELVLARDFGSEELTQLLVAAQILLHRTRSAGGPADTTAAMDALLAQDVGAKMFAPCTEALYSVDACHDMTTEARTIVYSSTASLCFLTSRFPNHPNLAPLIGRVFGPKPKDDEWLVKTGFPEAMALLENAAAHPVLRMFALGPFVTLGVEEASDAILEDLFVTSDHMERIITAVLSLAPHLADPLAPAATICSPQPSAASLVNDYPSPLAVLMFHVTNALARRRLQGEAGQLLLGRFAEKCVSSGLVALALTFVRAFQQLPSAAEGATFMCFPYIFLQQVALMPGGRELVFSEIRVRDCSPQQLHSALMSAMQRGHEVQKAWNIMDVSLRAAMALGCLFGTEEADDADEGRSVTVPEQVVDRLVTMLFNILQGKDPSSPATCLDILHILSVSDANTNRLVMANVLDAIVLALTQGVDAMEDWAGVMKYPVSPCREGCASLLLNLALSDKTVEAVRAHSELQVAIQKALDDVKNLSAKTKQRLNDAAFRIKLSVQPVQPQASPRKSTASQHIMLSYCWAQQKQVLKIRQALGKRQYKIWLDVEQMSGSTGKIDLLDSEATLT